MAVKIPQNEEKKLVTKNSKKLQFCHFPSDFLAFSNEIRKKMKQHWVLVLLSMLEKVKIKKLTMSNMGACQ